MEFIPALALIGSMALALWLAFSESAVFALLLVIVIAGWVRHLIRLWTGWCDLAADLERPAGDAQP